MDSFVDERDYKILENDKYTFFVLGRVMGGECDLLLTDHERLIICFTCNPYPIWIWTPDDVTDEEKEKAYALARENGLLTEGHTFNLKYELADYFIRRSSEDAIALSIKTNMFAYDCPNPIEPHVRADGELHRCVAEDIDELVEFMDLFHRETGVDQDSLEAYRHKAEEAIRNGRHFFFGKTQTAGMRLSVTLDRMATWRASAWCIRTRSTEESTMQKIWFTRSPKWQRTQDICLCFIRMQIMSRRMLVTRRSDMFSKENCVL